MWFRNAFLAAGLAALPLAANAQPIAGPYISLGGGLGITPDTTKIFGYAPGINGGDVGPAGYPVTLKDGYAISGALGYGFGNGFRFELEGGYRSNPLNHLISPYFPLDYHGNEQNKSAIVSVLYDLDVGLPIFPYVGAGAGLIWNTESNVTITRSNAFNTINLYEVNNGTQVAPAFQITGGVSYPIAAVPGLSLTLDYKFLGMPERRTFGRVVANTFVGSGAPANQGVGYATFSGEYNHAIMVGVRYAFGAAPAASPPAAAPVPAAMAPSPVSRSYIVFFDWDKADLTDRAKQIVSEAASASGKIKVTRIEVNGYTDASGTQAYNQGLSVARAKAVMAELVKDGVPASAIAIMGYGETHPLVPTGAGEREPRNRRVEIIIK